MCLCHTKMLTVDIPLNRTYSPAGAVVWTICVFRRPLVMGSQRTTGGS